MASNADHQRRGSGFGLVAVVVAIMALPPCRASASVSPGNSKGTARSPRHVIVNPDWIKQPDGNALAAYYPKLAQMIELGGRARIRCTLTALGALEDCQVRHEAPIGMGFGEAAIKLTPYFRMRPKTVDGQEVAGASVTIPIRFKLTESDAEVVEKAALTTPAPAATAVSPNDPSLRIARAFWGDGQFANAAEVARKEIVRQLSYQDEPVMTQQQQAALDIYIDVQKSRERSSIDTTAAAYRKAFSAEELSQLAAMVELPIWTLWRGRLPAVEKVSAALSADLDARAAKEPARLFCLKYACATDADTTPPDEE